MRHDEVVEEITRLSETIANLKKQLDKPKSKLDSFKLHDILAQIVTLDQEYMHELQQNDPTAANGTLESKRNILLQQAEDLADRAGVPSAEDQLSLGNSYVFRQQV